MNLAVTPVKFNNYSATQNCKRNNSQQNFEALPVKLTPLKEEIGKLITPARKRDMVIDRFQYHFEKTVEKLGLKSEKLEKEGYILDFIPEYPNSSKMTAFLKDKKGNIVQDKEGIPVMTKVRSGLEESVGEEFAHQLDNIDLLG